MSSSGSTGPFRAKALKPPRSSPVPRERVATQPPLEVVAAVVRGDAGRLLITQRLAGDTLGGYWEFPGGKVEPGESHATALARELREELGVETAIGALIHHTVHAYPDRDVRLFFYEALLVSGEPRRLEVADLRWVTPAELMDFQFPEADRALLEQLQMEGRPPT